MYDNMRSMMSVTITFFLLWLVIVARCHDMLVVNTWDFQDATVAAFNALVSDVASALDAVEEVCRRNRSDWSI